jgi:hypothetical protein
MNMLERRLALSDPALKEQRLARIEQLEDEVFEQAVGIVQQVLAFGEVSHDQVDPPQEWIDQFGEDEAAKRLKLAKSGWLPASASPAAFKYALQAMGGIAKGRAWRVKVTQNNLNVKIALPAPTSTAHPGPITYEVRDLDP